MPIRCSAVPGECSTAHILPTTASCHEVSDSPQPESGLSLTVATHIYIFYLFIYIYIIHTCHYIPLLTITYYLSHCAVRVKRANGICVTLGTICKRWNPSIQSYAQNDSENHTRSSITLHYLTIPYLTRQTDRQKDGQTDRQTERQRNRHRHKHRHTLRILCTELNAVPHASLRNPNPERSRKVLKNLEVCKKK